MSNINQPKIIVLCTLSTGLDCIAEVIRNGFTITAVIGLNPNRINLEEVSGFIDIKNFCLKWNTQYIYVDKYSLNSTEDKIKLLNIEYDLIWVTGWQRLIPSWLIDNASLGALGGHGSPDGINGGRGRSPQNWAILMNCRRFDLALFKITPEIDNGPVIIECTYYLNEIDDINISYKKASICLAKMMVKVLKNTEMLNNGIHQNQNASYYPQRKPEDGFVDWSLNTNEIWAHCRALTKPYPGLRTKFNNINIIIWDCIPFDEEISNKTGEISFVFEDNTFLVSCGNGRIIINNYESDDIWKPVQGMILVSESFTKIIRKIKERHLSKYNSSTISNRIENI